MALRALLVHGHNSADLEAGRVTIEDAFLLMESDEKLAEELSGTEQDLQKHFDLESKRVEAGLETDFQRYISGGRIRD